MRSPTYVRTAATSLAEFEANDIPVTDLGSDWRWPHAAPAATP